MKKSSKTAGAAPKAAAKPAAKIKAAPKRAARSAPAAATLDGGAALTVGSALSSPTLPVPVPTGPVTRAEFQKLSSSVAALERQVAAMTRKLQPFIPRMNDGGGDGGGSGGSDGSI